MSEWDQQAGADPGFGASASPPRQRAQPVPGTSGRKKGTACSRCRSQKIRCDDDRPACSPCARLGHPCVRPNLADNPDAVSHVTQMEARLRFLEESLRNVAPDQLDRAPCVEALGVRARAQRPAVEPQDAAMVEPVQNSFGIDTAAADLQDQWNGAGAARGRTLDQHMQDQEPAVFSNPLAPRQSAAAVMPDAMHKQHLGTRSLSSTHSTASPALTALSPAPSSQIGPSEPLAHEVGMLSLANSRDSKYLGPSSGISFARLIFAAIPQSQGLSTGWSDADAAPSRKPQQAHPFPANWKSDVDLQHFVDAYFETFQPMYPFLDEDMVSELLESLCVVQDDGVQSLHMSQLDEGDASLQSFHSVQLFLIIALGARTLEDRLSTDFSAERYLATAIQRVGSLTLHDNIAGMQIMLLLALSSFYFEDGPNAWFLVANIIASCQDLGLQRRSSNHLRILPPEDLRRALVHDNLRRGIFWSVYSLERTLAVVLGRPLTLRDEAIDIEFPGRDASNPYSPGRLNKQSTGIDTFTPDDGQSPSHPTKRMRIWSDPFVAAQYSFSFDQITAEIKLMLYRVNNLPNRFPWPTDLDTWQTDVHARCDALMKALRSDLRDAARRSSSGGTIRSLELKYHQCIMLLYRPSPAITGPSLESWRKCYDSAVSTIKINSELHRFSKLANSWLTAHAIFVSGITFLYCLWVRPEIRQHTSLNAFTSNAAACTVLLKYLAKAWSVAADAVAKFERLVHLTAKAWGPGERPPSAEVAAGHSLLYMSQRHGAQGLKDQWPRNDFGEDAVLEGSVGLDGSTVVEDYAGVCASDQTGNFYHELGDVGSWFDLDWLIETTDFSAVGDGPN